MQILGRRLIIFFFFNPINPIEMNISLKLFLASLPILFLPVGLQAQLDEQVPYQGDTLLTNPTQRRDDGNGRVFMDCDWQIMASMIRDLEERIAGEVETDTLYGDYRTKELEGDRLFMRYECVILRDSILSLQVAYDEALAPRVTLDAAVVLSDTSAALSASFSGSGVASSGFEWALDSLMTLPQSGIGTGATSPIADTLTVLTPGKLHYFTAYAEKNSEKFYGDTLRLLTMPGISTDAAGDLTESSATLNASFTADSISAQGFVWGAQSDLSDGTSVSADTTGGSTAIEYELIGLTEGATYYFSAYATNASGTTYGDTLSFVAESAPCGDLTSVSYDGYDYSVVPIGSICWFAENLQSDNYRNGDAIPGNLYSDEWITLTSGAQAVLGNNDGTDDSNLSTYGRLYNWYAVASTRGLCPSGWHIPTIEEWETLTTVLGGEEVAGVELKSSTPDWDGNNSSGFSALPGGFRSQGNGLYFAEGVDGMWWSATPNAASNGAYYYKLVTNEDVVRVRNLDFRIGLSVRCARD
jgi:uncharacterized protein (TIGR02145 family)